MSEFTGERVIPGEVNDDLWAEHVARYHFAARFASGKRVLDIGCGTGYGTSELRRQAAIAIGIDACHDPLLYARAHDDTPRFAQALAGALPFADHSFELLTAFEVIEHLPDWRALLSEARRVLHPRGVLLISTPNKSYYAEARAKDGPNPFHVHEFQLDEFRDALAEFFPHVHVMFQNWNQSISFTSGSSAAPSDAIVASTSSTDSHFFLALCSIDAPSDPRSLIFVPSAANLLKEREDHIRLLEHELKQKEEWLRAITTDRDSLLVLLDQQKQQLEEHNRWAQQLDRDWKSALARVAQVQDEFRELQHRATAKLAGLEQENRDKTQWALDTEQRLTAALAEKCAELGEAVRLLDQTEATVVERTTWAQTLQQRIVSLENQLALIRDSRWVKLGRSVGIGPQVKLD